MQTQDIISEIERLKEEMAQALMELIRIPAIGPENGGDGELKKTERLTQMLKPIGFDKIERFDAGDSIVVCIRRRSMLMNAAVCGRG